jgi:23S rRNA pseudouridine1911/1915/1917 synthase
MGASEHILTVSGPEAGQRMDRALAMMLPELSRTRIKALIDQGQVMCDGGMPADASRKVADGEVFRISVPEAEPATPQPEDLPLAIVYEDRDLLVIDKVAGMTVHPAPGNHEHTLVNALLAHCGDSLSGIGGVRRPGIVHRLDKDTSGLMVAAKNDAAHAGLSAQLADHSLSRRYMAVVWGLPQAKGSVDKPLGRSRSDRKKMAVVANGKPSITHYELVRPLGNRASLIRCRLETGRTHQIRVHMAAIGHPLVGDPVYAGRTGRMAKRPGDALSNFARQALHSAEISFLHPRTGKRLDFTSNLPPDMAELILAAGEQIGG